MLRAPGHVVAEFNVSQALGEIGEERLRQRLLAEMASEAAA